MVHPLYHWLQILVGTIFMTLLRGLYRFRGIWFRISLRKLFVFSGYPGICNLIMSRIVLDILWTVHIMGFGGWGVITWVSSFAWNMTLIFPWSGWCNPTTRLIQNIYCLPIQWQFCSTFVIPWIDVSHVLSRNISHQSCRPLWKM